MKTTTTTTTTTITTAIYSLKERHDNILHWFNWNGEFQGGGDNGFCRRERRLWRGDEIGGV